MKSPDAIGPMSTSSTSLYLLVTRGHNCGQAARVYLAHFVMAKSIFFLLCYTRFLSLSLILDLQYQPSAHLIYSSSLATVSGHHVKRIIISKRLQTEEIRVKEKANPKDTCT